MFKYILLPVLLFFLGDVQACVLKGYQRYIKAGKLGDLAPGDTIKFSDCPHDIQENFVKILSSSSGKVLSGHLQEILKGDGSVQVYPEKIEIVELEEVLKRKYPLRKNWIFQNTYFTGKRQFYPYEMNKQLALVCHNCKKPGKKMLEIRFEGDSKKRVEWGKTDIAIRVSSLVPRRTLEVGTLLNPSDFESHFFYTVNSNDSFFANREKLPFYKTNKVVREGMALKSSDVYPVNLISVGKPVKTIIKKDGMKLTGMGISLRNGKLGDSVHIKGMDGKKMIVGNVIGFNKVEVEL